MNNSVSLPAISRSNVDNTSYSNNMFPVEVVDDGKSIKHLNRKMEMMASLNYPDIDQQASVKARISALETAAGTQSTYNKCNDLALHLMEKHVQDVDGNIKNLLLSMQSDFDQRISSLQKEYDHR